MSLFFRTHSLCTCQHLTSALRDPRFLARLLLLLSFVVFLGACDVETPATSAKSDTVSRERPLVFAMLPYDTPSRLLERYRPFADYLGQRLGRPVELYMATSYEDQIRRVVAGDVDLAHMGPTTYLRARDRYRDVGSEPISIVAGESHYTGVIIVRADSPIRSTADLADHTFAFGSHQSFASHYIAKAMLLRAGVTLADLRDYGFLERHERVILSVLHGDYDAGGTTRGLAERYLAREPGLRIIDVSPPLPPLVVAARAGLPVELLAQVRKLLVAPDGQGEAAIRGMGAEAGFRLVDDEEFDFARRVVNRIDGDSLDVPLPW